MINNRKLMVTLFAMVAVIGMASACTPPASDGTLPTKNWSFKGTTVRVDDAQDAVDVPLIGCVVNCKDEPYLLNIGFRVKIGVPGSAQAWAVNNRTSAPQDVGAGSTVSVGAAGGPVVFNNVAPVDLLDLANTNNHLEIMGTYVWASEEDQIGNGLAADSMASLLKDALNETLAKESLDNLDANFILDLVFSNIGNALGIAVQNIPLFGLGDDVMGGALYIGIGAQGTLGSLLDTAIGETPFPQVNIPVLDIPPSIDGGGFFTMTGSKSWTRSFHGGCGLLGGNCGQHTWTMVSGAA
ncbi:MAG: hypothetical protein WBF71_12450 [Microthrixaceae bacterium]